MVYQLKYDSIFGRFTGNIEIGENCIIVDGHKIRVFSESDASLINWAEYGAEYIVESSGAFATMEKAGLHKIGGAKKVILTAPSKDDVMPTFVMGVNHDKYTSDMQIVSNASCTTNCLAPMAKVIFDKFGIKQGLMATIHASTSKQHVVDSRSEKDWRTGRSVYGNIIPSTTGAAKAVGLVIPELAGKMTGISYRIPAADVSLVDLNVETEKATSIEEIREAMKEAAEGPMKGILEFTDEEVTSIDFLADPHTSVFDSVQSLELSDHLFKIVGYYDNEFGYSNKLLELAKHMNKVDNE
jgi:glyceraldehyde 3-phosphate dehydrogenase